VIAKLLRLITMKYQRRVIALAAIGGGSVLLQGCGKASPDSTPDTPDTPDTDLVQCTSSRTLPSIVSASQKGFCVEDVTMQDCPDKLINAWPHSAEVQPVTSFRLFAAWKPEWDSSLREHAWQALSNTSGKILIGTEVKFVGAPADGILDTQNNQQMFEWALELMQILGPDRIMGFQIGNEVDHSGESAPAEFWDTVTGGFSKLMWQLWTKLDLVTSQSQLRGLWVHHPSHGGLNSSEKLRKNGERGGCGRSILIPFGIPVS